MKNPVKVRAHQTIQQQRHNKHLAIFHGCMVLFRIGKKKKNDKASTVAQLNNQGCLFFLFFFKSACEKSFQFSLDRK